MIVVILITYFILWVFAVFYLQDAVRLLIGDQGVSGGISLLKFFVFSWLIYCFAWLGKEAEE